MTRFSRTVSSVSRVSCWGTTPSRARICGPSRSGSSPRTAAVRRVSGRDAPDHPHRRRLAGAVRSEEAEGFARRDVEVDRVDRGEVSPKRLVSPRAWMSDVEPDRLEGVGHGRAWYSGCADRGLAEPSPCRGHAQNVLHMGSTSDIIRWNARNHPWSRPMATIPAPVAELLERALVGELTVVDGTRPARHLPAHPAVGRRAGLHDVVDAVQPQARAHRAQTRGCRCRSRTRSASADRPIGPRSRATPGSSPTTRTAAGSACCRSGRPRSRRSSTFLKARVALPLFFERALIEITPRRVLYWSDGDSSGHAIGHDLAKEAA